MISGILEMVSLAVTVAALGVLVVNLIWRRWDVLSWRNVMLLGFIYFQSLSAYFLSRGMLPPEVPLDGTGGTTLAVCLLTFFVVYMIGSWIGRRQHVLSYLVPRVELPANHVALTLVIALLLVVGLAMAFFVERSYTAGLAAKFRGSLAAAATGLATYYVFARRFNPYAWVLLIGTIGLAVLISVVGHPGRRSVLTVFMVIPWMLYFVSWRYLRAGKILNRVVVAIAVGVLAIVVYSPIRFLKPSATLEERRDQVTRLLENPFEKVTGRMLSDMVYSDAAPNSLFVIENYPGTYPYQPGAAFIWIMVNPIPRSMWLDKPEALGATLQKQMHAGGNLGPGFIGHAWQEGGFLGVLAHALFFGLLVGVVDRALALRAANPYFVALAGCYLGDVLAMPRGDIGLFLAEVLSGMAGVTVVFWSVQLLLGTVLRAFPPLLPPAPTEDTPEFADLDGAPAEYHVEGMS